MGKHVCALMMYLQTGLASLLLFKAVSQQGQRHTAAVSVDETDTILQTALVF